MNTRICSSIVLVALLILTSIMPLSLADDETELDSELIPTWVDCWMKHKAGNMTTEMQTDCDTYHTNSPTNRLYGIRWIFLNVSHDEIPDDCPGVSIITEGAFIALIKEGARLGVLQNASFSEHATLERDILTKDEDNLELKKQILDLEEQLQAAKQSPHRSEGFELKEMAMQTLLKLTSMSDLERLTKE